MLEIVRLGWWILEQKLMYYEPQYGECVSDTLYDANEARYKKLCAEHGVEPTACNHVGFPYDTPAGRLVISKLLSGKKLTILVEPKRVRTRGPRSSEPVTRTRRSRNSDSVGRPRRRRV